MAEWMAQYIGAIGMSPASVVTTVFGAFCVTFVAIVCRGRLVKDFGPAGGMIAAGIIIGTFWVMNHKLPGFGIHPEGLPHPDGGQKQFGLIYHRLPCSTTIQRSKAECRLISLSHRCSLCGTAQPSCRLATWRS